MKKVITIKNSGLFHPYINTDNIDKLAKFYDVSCDITKDYISDAPFIILKLTLMIEGEKENISEFEKVVRTL
jgi:hypothetical protein